MKRKNTAENANTSYMKIYMVMDIVKHSTRSEYVVNYANT